MAAMLSILKKRKKKCRLSYNLLNKQKENNKNDELTEKIINIVNRFSIEMVK